jgi:hypothetical protein
MPKKAASVRSLMAPPGQISGRRIPLKVKKTSEHWSEYILEDGATLRFRPVLIEISRVQGKFNDAGDPIYEFKVGQLVDTKVPPKLKKKK